MKLKGRRIEITYTMSIYLYVLGMVLTIYYYMHSVGLSWRIFYAFLFGVFVVSSFIAYWIGKVTGDDEAGSIEF